MAKKVQNLNSENYRYLSDDFKNNPAFNEIDWSVASYLFKLETLRRNQKDIQYEVKEYIHPSIGKILKETNIKSRTTVSKSLKKLADNGVLKLELSTTAYEANKYYINEGWVNETPIEETIEGDESFTKLMSMLLELRTELRNSRKENAELINEVKALKEEVRRLSSQKIEEPKEIEVVEQRSIPHDEAEEIRIEPSVSPQMSQRMSKILERYDTFYKREEPKSEPQTPLNLDPKPQPLQVEIIEQRSMPQETKKQVGIDYSRYKLTDSIIKCGTCSLMYLSPEELKREIEVREKNNIDIKDVLNICKVKGVAV